MFCWPPQESTLYPCCFVAVFFVLVCTAVLLLWSLRLFLSGVFLDSNNVQETEYSDAQGLIIPAQSRLWGDDEEEAMTLLRFAGIGFAESWRTFLEPCLLWRQKTSASYKWYFLRKHGVRPWQMEHESAARQVARAKRLLLVIRQRCLDTAPRVVDPEIYAGVERKKKYNRAEHQALIQKAWKDLAQSLQGKSMGSGSSSKRKRNLTERNVHK